VITSDDDEGDKSGSESEEEEFTVTKKSTKGQEHKKRTRDGKTKNGSKPHVKEAKEEKK
jgi:hypothetical protein